MKKIIFFILAIAIAVGCGYSFTDQAPQNLKIEIKKIIPFPYCSIQHKGPYSDMEQVITELMNLMQNQNINPAGAMITIYFTSPEEKAPAEAKWEVGFPIMSQIAVIREPLQKKEWIYAQVAVAVHTGPYENTGDTIDVIFDWMEENGYVQDGPILGKYLNMPSANISPKNLKTEIWVPVKNSSPIRSVRNQ